MKTTDFNKEVTSTVIAENIEKLFDLNVDLTKYTREQLEDYRNKLRTRVFQHEGSSRMNDLLTNEEYQKDKAMLELLNTRIKEMLGEQMKSLLGKLDQLNEAKKAKPDFLDLDKDGNKKEPMKKAAKDAKVKEGAKPDFLDLDKDGNKKEPMKKAAKDAKVKESGVDESGLQYHTGVKKHGKEYMKKAAQAGRDGASQEELGRLRDKYSKAAKKDKKTNEETVSEKAVSKAQQQAAGVALAAKKAGKTPPGKGAAAQMAKMSTKELEKFAGTKHKGLPKHKKADEDVAEELLPKQKEVAKKILDKDMADAKASRAAKKQAGTMKNESFRKNVEMVNEGLIRLLKEDEEGKAKAITAASDMVNDFTSWMQRVGQYQTKSMIELADSIRANFGAQEAETFKQSVGPALAATLETLTAQREAISNAVAVLAGEAAPMEPMGQEPMEPGLDAAEPDALNTADELDAFAASDAASGAGAAGREVRESTEEKKARIIAEQHSIIARLAK